jgi:hypothetical protein
MTAALFGSFSAQWHQHVIAILVAFDSYSDRLPPHFTAAVRDFATTYDLPRLTATTLGCCSV